MKLFLGEFKYMAANAPAISALLQRGADMLVNMYDVSIQFPWADSGSILTTRVSNFQIPDASNEGYDISYHGVTIKRPKSVVTFNREFELEFAMDASMALYGEFVNWAMIAADPVTGMPANWASALGKVTVEGLAGAYNGTSVNDVYSKDTYAIKGDSNPKWTFYDVWVSKVGQPQFQTDGGDVIKYAVSFKFGDCDYPFYNATGITGTGRGGMLTS